MKDSIVNQIQMAKKERDVAFVNFFNDGSINTDTYKEVKDRDFFFDSNTAVCKRRIESYLCDVASFYSTYGDFDYLESDIKIGLIFKKEDVDENNHVKEGAKPLKNFVRVYDGHATSYLDGNQTNLYDYSKIVWGFNGYANYDELIKLLKKDGLLVECPNNFKDFVCAMATGVPFDVKVSADLREKGKTRTLKR